MNESRKTYLQLGMTQMFLSTFSFAMANVFVKTVSSIPVMEIVFFRSLIAGSICLYGIKKAGIDWRGNNRKFLIYRGLAGTIALVLFFTTIQNMPLASATVIQYLSPIFTATIGVFFLKEAVRPLQWGFYAVAFVGVLLVKQFDTRIALPYLVIGIIAAFGSGVAYNFVRSLKNTDHPLVIIFYFQIIGVIVSVPFLFYTWQTPSGLEWLSILLIGIFSQLGQVFLTNAFSRERAASVAIIVYSGLIYAITIGWVVWGEKQTWLTISGMILVVLGVGGSVMYSRRQRNYVTLEASIE